MPFSVADRIILGAVRGVGPTVIARLEQLDYVNLQALAGADVQDIVEQAAALLGSSCWKNSPQARVAIRGAIDAATGAGAAVLASGPVQSPRPSAQASLPLESVANLGPRSAAMLAAAGIYSVEHLAALGAVAAFAMVKRSGARVSLNLLWALEGALTGVPWQTVAREHRTSLLLALESYRGN